ncbi:MAG: CCA tRNA nucleotidyltransferase [Candidatus Limnocylindria bacterium]
MPPRSGDGELRFPILSDRVRAVLGTLRDAGHDAAIVGGAVRDRLLDLEHRGDWDVATSARPGEVAALFAGSSWDNRFGTVTVKGRPSVEITSFRTEGTYRDRRRPDEVRFGASLEEDLARRDFTINAIAWVPLDLAVGMGSLVDPSDGRGDLERRVLRAVGEPAERFGEDALRLIRAARFAGRFALDIDPPTEAALQALAPTALSVSAERIRDELIRILADPTPSRALTVLERSGVLAVVLPEVASLRGFPQPKPTPGDALDHTWRAVDAAPVDDSFARLAALVHDIGKASTVADGPFIGHERVGSEMAGVILDRLRVPRAMASAVVNAVRHHMYAYDPDWTDADVRRFIRRVGADGLSLVFSLRRADDAASGIGATGERAQRDLERRIGLELAASSDLLVHAKLAIDGDDVQRELGIGPGPRIGAVMARLLEDVLADPSVNNRSSLLRLARQLDHEALTGRTAPRPEG